MSKENEEVTKLQKLVDKYKNMLQNIDHDEQENINLRELLQEQLGSLLQESKDVASDLDQKKKEIKEQ